MSHTEKVNIISNNIKTMLERLHSCNVNIHSFCLYKKTQAGSFMATATASPLEEDGLHRMFSVSKTLTAIAVGLLYSQDLISLQDKICDFFPEFVNENTDYRIRAITIENMLAMQTTFSSTTYKNRKDGFVESFFTTLCDHSPGTIFHYDTSSSHVLCALVEKLTSTDLLSYVRTFIPALGLSFDSYMIKDPEGVSLGGTGLVAHPSDLFKLGEFFLNAHNMDLSEFKDRYPCNTNIAILKSYLISASTWQTATKLKAKSRFESFGYGYYLWMTDHDGFMLYGMGGQFAAIYPNENIMFVTTADTQGRGDDCDRIFNYFYDYILKNDSFMNAINSLDEEELKEIPVDYSDYIPLPVLCENQTYYRIVPENLSFDLNANEFGFSKVTLDIEDTAGNISLVTDTGFEYKLNFGFNNFKSGIFPKYNLKYLACGEFLTKDMLYVRFNILDKYMGNVHLQFSFSDKRERLTLYMRKIEESLFNEFDGHLEGISTF